MPSGKGWAGDNQLHKVDLPQRWIEHCGNMGESGMGYQKVIIKTQDNKEIHGIVLNGEHLETVTPVDVEKIVDIQLE